MGACVAFPATTATPAESRPEDPAAALRKLQPALTREQARALARVFIRTAARPDCLVEWQILASIAFHESSLGLYTTNARTGDHTIMQINERTMARLRLNPERLKRDVGYAVQSACRIVRANRDAYSNRPYWLGVYRAGTRFSNPAIVRSAESYTRIIERTAREIVRIARAA